VDGWPVAVGIKPAVGQLQPFITQLGWHSYNEDGVRYRTVQNVPPADFYRHGVTQGAAAPEKQMQSSRAYLE